LTETPSRVRLSYVVAALAIASIIPYTALYMEPGVNGAGKWKVQESLRDEGFQLKAAGAEKVVMKTIAKKWVTTNSWRYVITGFAMAVSAIAIVINE
jgi:hypothetical protein